MGLLSYLKEKTTGLIEWGLRKGKQAVAVVGNVTEYLGLNSTAEKCRKIEENVEKHRRKWEEKHERAVLIHSHETSHRTYNPKIDEQTLNNSKEYMAKEFKNKEHLKEKISNMSGEERIDYTKKIVEDISELLKVPKPENIEFFENEYGLCGGYDTENDTLVLNALQIANENYFIETIYTSFHELYHKRQYMAATLKENYGYDKKYLIELNYNFQNYVQPNESFEAYRKQPVEVGAFGFEKELKTYFNKK